MIQITTALGEGFTCRGYDSTSKFLANDIVCYNESKWKCLADCDKEPPSLAKSNWSRIPRRMPSFMQTSEKKAAYALSPTCVEWTYGYVFESGDYACVNQKMYQCKPPADISQCKLYSPTSDEGAKVWTASSINYNAASNTQTGADCVKWVSGFNFEEKDLVCEVGKVWECKPYPASESCSQHRPSSLEGSRGWDLKSTLTPPPSVSSVGVDWIYGARILENDSVLDGADTYLCTSPKLCSYIQPSAPGAINVYQKLSVAAPKPTCKMWQKGTSYSVGGLACDATKVWQCKDALTCSTYQPSGPQGSYSWTESKVDYNPSSLSTAIESPTLWTFELNYNYVGGDLVTVSGTDAYRCKQGHLDWTCKSTTPSPTATNSIWEKVTYTGTPKTAYSYMLPEIECYDFQFTSNYVSVHEFKSEQFACDGDRVFKCMYPKADPLNPSDKTCQNLQPREDQSKQVWALTRAKPKAISSKPNSVPCFQWQKGLLLMPQDIVCVNQSIYMVGAQPYAQLASWNDPLFVSSINQSWRPYPGTPTQTQAPSVSEQSRCVDWDSYSLNSNSAISAFHQFQSQEIACSQGRAFRCIAANDQNSKFSSVCTKTDPKTDNGNTWFMLRSNAIPFAPEIPPSVKCMKYEKGKNYIKGDLVCSDTVNFWMCSDKQPNTLACSQVAPVAGGDKTWILQTLPGIASIQPAFESAQAECYQWADATNPQSERPYKFEYMDLSCDEGRVWQCYGGSCNENKPSLSQDWVLLRAIPKQIQPPAFTWIEAFLWQNNTNYLPGDYAEDPISGFIYKCNGFPLTLDCSFKRPAKIQINQIWVLQQGLAVKNIIENRDSQISQACKVGDFKDLEQNPLQVNVGDFVCSNGRVWKCLTDFCKRRMPLGDFNQVDWQLTRFQPSPISTSLPEETAVSSLEASGVDFGQQKFDQKVNATLIDFGKEQISNGQFDPLVKNGAWTNNDWQSIKDKIQVIDGQVLTEDTNLLQRLKSVEAPYMSQVPLEGEPSKTYAQPIPNNVARILKVFPKDKFKALFPLAQEVYSYDGFIQAVSAFPQFCGEKGTVQQAAKITEDEVCKKELSTLFSHIVWMTGGRDPQTSTTNTVEPWLAGLRKNSDTKDTQFESVSTLYSGSGKYNKRGALSRGGIDFYGRLSTLLFNDAKVLLDSPEKVEKEPLLAFASALYFYMTPQDSQSPSMHEIQAGFWSPNDVDKTAGVVPGFGATIMLANPQLCGSTNADAQKLYTYYVSFMTSFSSQIDVQDSEVCVKSSKFPPGGSATIANAYFAPSKDGSIKCDLVKEVTKYSIFSPGDYKRCILDSFPQQSSKLPSYYFIKDYNYLPGDLVTNGQQLWQCSDLPFGLGCTGQSGPQIGEQSASWLQIKGEIQMVQPDWEVFLFKQKCTDWKKGLSWEVGQFACDASRAWKCQVPDECAFKKPSSQSGLDSSWELTRGTPVSAGEKATAIDAFVQSFEWNQNFNYLGGDRVFMGKARESAAINSVWECQSANQVLCAKVIPSTNSQVWAKVEGTALQISAPKLESKSSFDWKLVQNTKVATGTEPSYKFRAGDYASDASRVWLCKDGDKCQTTQPSKNANGDVWTLQRFLPYQVVPTPDRVCIEWSGNYNFVPNDLVCKSGKMWKCERKKALECSQAAPKDVPSPTDPWQIVSDSKGFETQVTGLEDHKCISFDAATGPTTATPHRFIEGNYACDADRVFLCKESKLCNTIKPSLDDGTIWQLTRSRVASVAPTAAEIKIYELQNDNLESKGIWTGRDWTDTTKKIQFKDGKISGLDSDMQRKLWSIQAVQKMDTIVQTGEKSSKPNVDRVMRVFNEQMWEKLTPLRLPVYTYQSFLQAISRYPAFCGERGSIGQAAALSDDQMCLKELSTLFAHMTQETGRKVPGATVPQGNAGANEIVKEEWRQALARTEEQKCENGQLSDKCKSYYSEVNDQGKIYPRPSTSVNYFGRGPVQLKWNYNYGAFSNSIFGDAKVLLDNPERVASEGWLAFASALWIYMTPVSPKPSMHDIVAGFWQPNSIDKENRLSLGFGATTNVLAGVQECGGTQNKNQDARINYYKELLTFFAVPISSEETLSCAQQSFVWPKKGAGAIDLNFDKDINNNAQCKLVPYITQWSIANPGDYKKCVCHFYRPCDLTVSQENLFAPSLTNCIGWVLNFNYLPGELVFHSNKVWKCSKLPATLLCSTLEPSASSSCWTEVLNVLPEPGSMPQVNKQRCYDYQAHTSSNAIIPYTFKGGDFACDANRVWKCLSFSDLCQSTRPSEDIKSIWELLRNEPEYTYPIVKATLTTQVKEIQSDVLTASVVWSDKDWTDAATGISTSNGQISANSDTMKAKIWAGQALQKTITIDLQNPSNNPINVQRTMSLLTETAWDKLTPFRLPTYTYESFLTAVSRYPAFCGERGLNGQAATLTDDQVCLKELATLFAHIAQETGWHVAGATVPKGYANAGEIVQEEWRQALSQTEESNCENGILAEKCKGYYSETNNHNTIYPRPSTKVVNYFGRGPLQLKWNYNYGAFSNSIFGDAKVLLDYPERVATEGWLAFASALWIYMTPQSPKPSMHDITVGNWRPSTTEINSGLKPGFGATIRVFSGEECGTWNQKAKWRTTYYDELTQYLGIPSSVDEVNSCVDSTTTFNAESTSASADYFEKDEAAKTCKLTKTKTNWSIYIPGDLKRCICFHFGPCDLKATLPTESQSQTPQSFCLPYSKQTNYLPGDFVCDKTNTWECTSLPNALRCKEDNLTVTTTWIAKNVVGTMKLAPLPMSAFSKCYDYSKSVLPGSASQHSFKTNDKACDEGRVWICKDESKCNITKPSTNDGTIWTLTRDFPEIAVSIQLNSFGVKEVNYSPQKDTLTVEGVWKDSDWTDSVNQIENINGQIKGKDSKMSRFIWAAQARYDRGAIDFAKTDSNPENVRRVMNVLSKETWEYLLPLRNAVYSYEEFLVAVSKFPAFCGEKGTHGQASALSDDEMCKKEISALFAHAIQATGLKKAGTTVPLGQVRAGEVVNEIWRQGLYYVNQIGCEGLTPPDRCTNNYSTNNGNDVNYPRPDAKTHYFGRGALQLQKNFNYGKLSKLLLGDAKILLNNPEMIAKDGAFAFASALWLYMTPDSPKPSMHEIITGFWVPNAEETALGFKAGFGATINVINGKAECQKWTQAAQDRFSYFKELMNYFKVPLDTKEDDTCQNMPNAFVAKGSAAVKMFLDKDWKNKNRCKAVSRKTPYSVIVPGDYKRCVCNFYGPCKLTNIVTVTKLYTPTPNCFGFKQNFNYLPGDIICDASAAWKCNTLPKALTCGTKQPNLFTQVEPWVSVVLEEIISGPAPAVIEQQCYDYEAQKGTYTFVIGNFACDSQRVWKCLTAACTSTKPSTGDGSVWELTRNSPLTIVPYIPVVINYTSTNDILNIDGIWTGKDWEEQGFKSANGQISGLNSKQQRALWASQATYTDTPVNFAQPINNPDNVKRVLSVLSETQWAHLFPFMHPGYNYKAFITAVSKYPAFCGERGATGQAATLTDDDMCKKELSTLFAHIVAATRYENKNPVVPAGFSGAGQSVSEGWRRGLSQIEESECQDGMLSGQCYEYYDTQWGNDKFYTRPTNQTNYFGRGALSMAWNYNFGSFSENIFGDEKLLLQNPERVAQEPWLAFASAIWVYMTPVSPKPSIHDVVTGFWEPNTDDLARGLKLGFGSTISILSGEECGLWTQKAQDRIDYFRGFMSYFTVALDPKEELTCEKQLNSFSLKGAGAQLMYFDQDWSNKDQCMLVPWQTSWNVYNPGDYKRCVCYYYGPCDLIPVTSVSTTCYGSESNYNWLAGDYICDTLQIWKCQPNPLQLQCKTETPSSNSQSWILSNQRIVKGKAPVMGTMKCYEYSEVKNTYTFRLNEYACDQNRVWLCKSDSGCNTETPSTGSEQKWLLTRYQPSKIAPPQTLVLDYIPQKDVLPENGPWTNSDWVDETNQYQAINGQISGTNNQSKRHLWASMATFTFKTIVYDDKTQNPMNVQRVMRVLTESMWEKLTPFRLPIYTYDSFLIAVSRYPAFCGERGSIGQAAKLTDDQICLKELATLFAHINQETGWKEPGATVPKGHAGAGQVVQEEWRQALAITEEWTCENGALSDKCKGYFSEANNYGKMYPRPLTTSVNYFGRGALQLKWNYNYGAFSKSIFGEAKVLLDKPQRVASEGWLAFASALWIYMTPVSPRPSMHDIVAGFWQPNTYDTKAGFKLGFGATINVINGVEECQTVTQKAKNRTFYYESLLERFGIPKDQSEDSTCASQQRVFSDIGAGSVSAYFDKSSTARNQCSLRSIPTSFSLYNPGDYKRCVCFYFGPCELDAANDQINIQIQSNCFAPQKNFNYMPNDKVCDVTTIWQCSAVQTDALFCNSSPYSSTSIWTQFKESPISGSAPIIEPQKCYNWQTATAATFSTPYKFKTGDFGFESERVWKCLSDVTCNSTKPSTDKTASVWVLTRFSPIVITPQVVIQVSQYDPQPDILPKLGPWSNNDWTDTVNNFKVVDGQLFGTTEKTQRDIWSAQAKYGLPPVDFVNKDKNPDNVKRVLTVFTQEKWSYLTPFRDPFYTYENFVTAISKFPAFCGEKGTVGQAAQLNLDQVCLKEISNLFAHLAQETGYHTAGAVAPTHSSIAGQKVQEEWRQSLYYLNEIACSKPDQAPYCDYYSTSWGNDIEYPRKDEKTKFYGRGPLQLSWNYNYGQFSESIFGDRQVLLDAPERVTEEGWLAFAASFWFYMTPQNPKPSMHDIVTGFWQPNSVDSAAGFKLGFGATINVINGVQECGQVSQKAQWRQDYYLGITKYLGVPVDTTESLSCSGQKTQFQPKGTAGSKLQYLDKDWTNKNRCQLVQWYTTFSIFTPGDYKRCVCKHYGPCDLTPSTIVVPAITVAQTCSPFSNNYNYLAGDKVCNTENIWTCNPLPKALLCSSELPSNLGSGDAWKLDSGTIQSGPAPFSNVRDCFDYESQKATYNFKLNDFACDAKRVWKCVLVLATASPSCQTTKPSTGVETIWMLLRDIPNPVIPQTVVAVSYQRQDDILKTDGVWTGKDWADAARGLKVVNGQVIGTNDTMNRNLWSATAVISSETPNFEDVTKNPPNVQRIMKIMTKNVWEYLTPFRNPIYTYESFITAVSKYPAFCGEKGSHGQASALTEIQMCKKEIATIFAHFCQETGYNAPQSTVPEGYPGAGQVVSERWRQGFHYVKEKNCDVTAPDGSCEYYSTAYGNDINYPRPDGKTQYFGRGALQLSWNYNYGYFSEVIFGDSKTLLDKPERVANEGWLAIASALWFYMTPQTPKPSMHDITTGFWVPNTEDTNAGFKAGFGATINVINGAQECGFYSYKAQWRVDNFKSLMDYFQVPLDTTEILDCTKMSGTWPAKGSGVVLSYFDKDWNKEKTCKLVSWQTPWSLYSLGDYKRCVCNYDGPCDLTPQQVVDPAKIEKPTCFEYAAQFNYLPGDRVCDTQNIWECQNMPAALACSTELPSTTNKGPAWLTAPISIRSGPAPTYGAKNCYDFQTAKSKKFTFVADSFACDSGRVFRCLNASQCNTATPSTSDGTAWQLLRDKAVVEEIPQEIQINYTPQDDILPGEGPWANRDWQDKVLNIANTNGKITGLTPEAQRIIWSPQARFDVLDVDFSAPAKNPANVQRVMKILTREVWTYLTPFRIQTYSYESFITAISKFPAFCGEKGVFGQAQYLSLDDICKKEIATLFAHFAQETGYNTPGAVAPTNTAGAGQKVQEAWRQSLHYLKEIACDVSLPSPNCDYYSTDNNNGVNYPRKDSTIKFFGRGPIQLSWNFNYGLYSKVQFGDTKVLLDAPERVSNEGWIAFGSSIWFYMTPQSPKPSMHDIVTGFWQPNAEDKAAGFMHGFGATINVINGALECGYISAKAKARIENFIALMQYFQVPIDPTESLSCSAQKNQFSLAGAAATAQFFDKDPSVQNSCKLVKWYTPYNLFTPGDYKRCVCQHYGPCNLNPTKIGGVQNCYQYIDNYNWLPEDRVCRDTKIWACQGMPKTLLCKSQSPLQLAYEDAWKLTTEKGQQVLIPPQIDQKCFDWFVSTKGADVYKNYIFKYNDFACNATRVWKCMAVDSSLCNKNEPSLTTDSKIWQLTRGLPLVILPQVEPNCFPFVQDFLFMPEDRVCTNTAIWQCGYLPLTLLCATENPTTTAVGTAWKKLSMPPSSKAAPTISDQDCYDWTVSTLTSPVPYKFALNDHACDEKRVWKCKNANLCTITQPKQDQGQIWALTRLKPKVVAAPVVALGPSSFDPQPDILPKEGIWTGQDFSIPEQGIEIVNGQVSGTTDLTKRAIWSVQARLDVKEVNLVNSAENPPNVQRVMKVLTQEKWEHITPCRLPAYSYTEFLKAVSRFPAFCGQKAPTIVTAASLSDDEMCKKEIAALFAHINGASGGNSSTGCPDGRALSKTPVDTWRQGLTTIKKVDCNVSSPPSSCDYYSTQWGNDKHFPRTSQDTKYFGRGPIMLTWNYNYGKLSQALFGDQAVLLNDPERVATEGWIAFSSALWVYMTPRPKTPSMHSVITGFWKPNTQDSTAGFKSGFGATITIMNYGCGQNSQVLSTHFQNLLQYFNVPAYADESVDCNQVSSEFPVTGTAGPLLMNFDNDWDKPDRCKLVDYGTSFQVFTPGDYKRCVCFYSGKCNLKPQASQCFAYQSNFNYLPGDLVCDTANMWKCEPQPTALTCKTEVPMASGSGVAWKKVNFAVNQVQAPIYEQTQCYDYTITKSYSFSKPYSFVSQDKVCDAGRVYECNKNDLCDSRKPSTDDGTVWTLKRQNPKPVDAPIPPNCWAFTPNYNYIPGDRVCTDTIMWQCKELPAGLQCSTTQPSSTTTATGTNPAWSQLQVTVPISRGAAPVTSVKECFDWTKTTTEKVYSIADGDYICDANRVWQCKSASICQQQRPSNFQTTASGQSGWQLLNFSPQTVVPVTVSLSTGTSQWTPFTTSKFADQNWIDVNNQYEIKNGLVSGRTAQMQKRLKSIEAPYLDKVPIEDTMNSQRVKRLFSETDFTTLFPLAQQTYTYQGFLKAVKAFPAFCNEKGSVGQAAQLTLDQMCMKELSTLFAHIAAESGANLKDHSIPTWKQGLYYIEDPQCYPNKNGSVDCIYQDENKSQMWPPFSPGSQYYGRGPLMLKGNAFYGALSVTLFNDRSQLLTFPGRVSAEDFVAFASAIYKYMTPDPQSWASRPSMHEIIAGFWEPNAADAGVKPGFGTTIMLIQQQYCSWATAEAAERFAFYKNFMDYFKLQVDQNESMDCRVAYDFKEAGSAAVKYAYFNRSWTATSPRCEGVDYETAWTVFRAGDYERCLQKHFS